MDTNTMTTYIYVPAVCWAVIQALYTHNYVYTESSQKFVLLLASAIVISFYYVSIHYHYTTISYY